MKVISSRALVQVLLVFLVGMSMSGFSVTLAQESDVGVLRVADVRHPRQVAPSAQVSFTIDAEYAIKENVNASVKSSLFEGSPGNLGAGLWQSAPIVVSGGGDQLWKAN